jgi:hypothetical protein
MGSSMIGLFSQPFREKGEGLLLKGVAAQAIRSMKAPGTAYDDPVLGKDPQPGHMRGQWRRAYQQRHRQPGVLRGGRQARRVCVGEGRRVIIEPQRRHVRQEQLSVHRAFAVHIPRMPSALGIRRGLDDASAAA